MTNDKTHRAIDAVWRIESARIIATVARMVRDVGVAEEIAQDTLVTALERWPQTGVPDNPGAWLTAAAKNRALDWLRRQTLLERKHEELGHELDLRQEMAEPGLDVAAEDDIGDDLLRLVFTACHPLLSTEARAALTLRLLGGLTTDEIARAFLVSEPTIAQRIVRAKRTLAEAHVPFEVPRKDQLGARLSSVLEVLYLIFNEGYSATAGEDWMRPALCEEGLRLGRILAELAPAEPEVHGLVALMEIQASRTRARIGPQGEPILLLEQDRGRWDRLLIGRGLAALERAESLLRVREVEPARESAVAPGANPVARTRSPGRPQAGSEVRSQARSQAGSQAGPQAGSRTDAPAAPHADQQTDSRVDSPMPARGGGEEELAGVRDEEREEEGEGEREGLGLYGLQAAIAACHARARVAEETDWPRIAALYGALAQRAPSPVVELNRAVAVAMASGAAAGLALVDALTEEPQLKNYHLLPSVRGDLLLKLGRLAEARAEFERAASLTRNARERNLLLQRAASCQR